MRILIDHDVRQEALNQIDALLDLIWENDDVISSLEDKLSPIEYYKIKNKLIDQNQSYRFEIDEIQESLNVESLTDGYIDFDSFDLNK